MTRQTLILAAAGGSAALLLGAFWFQYVVGLYPCPLCIWQRWPHAAAVLIGVVALALPGRVWPVLGALIIQMISTGIVILGIDQNYSQIIIGAVVIVAVLLDQFNAWLARRRLSAGAKLPA